METLEILRSSFTLAGERLFLHYEEGVTKPYRVGLRFRKLLAFQHIHDAIDAFESLELVTEDVIQAAKLLKIDIHRVPRWKSPRSGPAMARVHYLVHCVEQRQAGLQLKVAGRRSALEVWHTPKSK